MPAAFPSEGSHLERYSGRFSAVEINSSFYRPHRPSTYQRWAATVPADFRFAVKMPKEITHTRRLAQVAEPLTRFLGEAGALGEKLGPIWCSCRRAWPSRRTSPASFTISARASRGTSSVSRGTGAGSPTKSISLLAELRIARVAADPAVVPRAGEPGGWPGLRYYRLHGSPRMYYSAYPAEALDALARRLAGDDGRAWCMFDNTAEGAATQDAMTLTDILRRAD